MFSSIKEKLLGLSGSYTYYKNNYKELSEENKRLKRENEKIKDEKDNFIMSILSNQLDLNSNLETFRNEYLNESKKNNSVQNTMLTQLKEYKNEIINKEHEIKTSTNNITSTQDTILTQLKEYKNEIINIENGNSDKITNVNSSLSSQNELLDKMSKENEEITNAILSCQKHFTKDLKRNYDLLTDVEDLTLRVEKSSAYTNIKLDTKFDENERLLKKSSDDLYKKISSKINEK